MTSLGKKVTSIQRLRTSFLPWFRTFLLSLAGGGIFAFVGLPLPWILGPMVSVLLWSRFAPAPLYWPSGWRNAGLVAIGYMLGSSFNRQTLAQMIAQLPTMLLMTTLMMGFSVGLALLISRHTGLNFRTALTANIPGGLSQMVTLGEEMKGIDLSIVTFYQVTRLLTVIFIVPFLVLGLTGKAAPAATGGETDGVSLDPSLLLFGLIAAAGAWAARKLRFPTPFLMGPVLVIALFGVSGIHPPELPSLIRNLAQLFMGAYFGRMLKWEDLFRRRGIGLLAPVTGLALVLFSWGLGLLLVSLHHQSLVTAFLSLSPGGMATMGVVAREVDAELATVTGYQMFRVFFILFFIPPLLRRLFKPLAH